MARNKGVLNFTSNFEVKYSLPLDARIVVEKISDLDDNSVLDRNYLYNGMVVSCNEDSLIYILKIDNGNYIWNPIASNSAKIIELTLEEYDILEEKNSKTIYSIIPNHDYVDLGLPSGTLWATCNVGADTPEEYGDYFAWGETTGYNSGKSAFSWSTYKWCEGSETTMTKYCTNSSYGTVDGKKELDPEDDAAYVIWGSDWRMPTCDQIDELVDECTWTWTTMSDIKGYRVTGPSGSSIFLPAAGCRFGSSLSYAGSDGYYWSRTLGSDDPYSACCLYFYSGNVYWSSNYRFCGRSVRPVLNNFHSYFYLNGTKYTSLDEIKEAIQENTINIQLNTADILTNIIDILSNVDLITLLQQQIIDLQTKILSLGNVAVKYDSGNTLIISNQILETNGNISNLILTLDSTNIKYSILNYE